MITLFPNERLISQSTDGNMNLTTHRISYEHKSWGQSCNQSILLEDIISCENKDRSRILSWIVTVGILSIVMAFITPAKTAGIFLGIICFAIYWVIEKDIIVISSRDTTIKIIVTGMRTQKIIELVDKIEKAKNERLLETKKN
jgi:hypothetical protein